jgi:ankyrin repeat protein
MLEFLLSKGSPVDVRSAEGATTLMGAAQGAKPEQLEWLLSHGADVNARDPRGFTALHRAAEMGLEPLVELLLRRGADARVEAQGHTARSLAEKRGQKDIVRRLEAAGA